LAIAVVILAVTSVLVATTPARIAYRPSEVRTVRAGPDTVQLSVVPVGGHALDLHLYVFGADALPADVVAMRAVAEQSGSPIGAVSIPLVPAGTGHFVAGRVLLPHPGRWNVQLRVQVSEFDDYPVTTTVTVR
jgi:hypothetical protein